MDEPEQPLAKNLALLGYIAPGWEIIRPLPVLLERDEDGSFLISDMIFTNYGTGATPAEAHRDYVRSLIEYYGLVDEKTGEAEEYRDALKKLRVYLRPKIDLTQKALVEQIMGLLANLPPSALLSALDYILYLASREATTELEYIPGFMEAFERARKQIEAGDLVRFEDIRREP